MDSHPRKRFPLPLLVTTLVVLFLALAGFLIVMLYARIPRRLVQQLGDRRLEVRDDAYRQLRRRGDWFATDALLRGMREGRPLVRLRCAMLLGEKKVPRAFAPLTRLLADPDPAVRVSAVRAIKGFGEPRVLNTLLPMLRDKDIAVQEAAMAALRGKRDPRFIAALIAVLCRGDGSTKYQAAILLRNIGPPAVEPLLAALKTAGSTPRSDILSMLGKMKDSRAVPALKALAGDANPQVQRQAILALVTLGKPGMEALDGLMRHGNTTVCAQVATLLQFTDEPRAVDLLLLAIKDPRAPVRRAAALSLKWVPDLRRIDGLYAALHDRDTDIRRIALRGLEGEMGDRMLNEMNAMRNDPDPAMRRLALARLAEFNDPRVTAILRQLAQQPDCPLSVLVRLAAMGDPPAIPPLIRALRPPTAAEAAETAPGLTTPAKALAFMGEPARAPLLAAAHDADPAIRAGAVHALGMTGDPRALASPRNALRDPDPRVRRATAVGLEMSADVRGVPALIAALRDNDTTVRQAGIRALGATRDPKIIDPLLRLLRDPAPLVRAEAVRALAAFRDQRVIDAMQDLLLDFEPNVRTALAEGGAWADDPIGMGILAKLLPDGNKKVRDAASYTLRKLPDPRAASVVIPLVNAPDASTRRAAVSALEGRTDAGTIDALVSALFDEESEVHKLASQHLETLLTAEALPEALRAARQQNADARFWAVRCLGAAGSAALEPLRGFAEDLDSQVRVAVAHSLGLMRDGRAVPLLLGLLDDPEIDVRIEAIGSLGNLKDARGAAKLIPFLESGDVHEVYAAAWSLAQIKDSRAIGPLAACMENQSYRYSAMKALGQYEDREAIVELEQLLKTTRLRRIEKLELLELLGKHRDAYSLQVILNYLAKFPGDQDAMLGLAMRGETSVAEPLRGYLRRRLYCLDPKLQCEIINAMGKLNERRATPLLLQSLGSVNVQVAAAAARALGEIDDPRVVDALFAVFARGALGRNDPEADIRQAAAEALGRMKRESVRARLRAALTADNWRTRDGAARALGVMGEAWAEKPLKAALKDPQPQVRASAGKALKGFGD